MKLPLSICAAESDSDLPVRLLLWGFFVCFSLQKGIPELISHLWTKCCLSIESSLRPFDVFCIKLGEREGGEVTVLPGFILLKYLQQQTFWDELGYNIICRLDCIVIMQ